MADSAQEEEYKVLESALRSTNIFCFSSFELNFPSEPEEERIKVFHLLSLSAVGWARFQRPIENIRFLVFLVFIALAQVLWKVSTGEQGSILTCMRNVFLQLDGDCSRGGRTRTEGRGGGGERGLPG